MKDRDALRVADLSRKRLPSAQHTHVPGIESLETKQAAVVLCEA